MTTLNPRRALAGDRVLFRTTKRHPCFDLASLAARREVARLQGARRTYFAGAYFGFGFHEDGFRSGTAAAASALADSAELSTRIVA
jgi:predicted NAD/FAD-binding protein